MIESRFWYVVYHAGRDRAIVIDSKEEGHPLIWAKNCDDDEEINDGPYLVKFFAPIDFHTYLKLEVHY